MTLSIRRLDADDPSERFESGDPDLDRFFRRYAGQNQSRHHLGVTYVAVEDDAILGFATLSAAALEISGLPMAKRLRLPSYPLPVLRLARLAVDQRAQGCGVGLALLESVFLMARRMAADYGCMGVVVDAKPQAVAFYERYGFSRLEALQGRLGDRPEPIPMFLELGAIP